MLPDPIRVVDLHRQRLTTGHAHPIRTSRPGESPVGIGIFLVRVLSRLAPFGAHCAE
jgi:hypothetical protein